MPEENAVLGELTWVQGMQFVAQGGASGVPVVFDSAAEAGGLGHGLRPMEALLLALGGCTAMDVISILQKKRQDVTGFKINLKGWRAAEHPRRYTEIALEFVVRGHDVSPEAVARSIELSETKYCSVAASLNAKITTTYRVEQEGIPA